MYPYERNNRFASPTSTLLPGLQSANPAQRSSNPNHSIPAVPLTTRRRSAPLTQTRTTHQAHLKAQQVRPVAEVEAGEAAAEAEAAGVAAEPGGVAGEDTHKAVRADR